jgi:hypothetical protein
MSDGKSITYIIACTLFLCFSLFSGHPGNNVLKSRNIIVVRLTAVEMATRLRKANHPFLPLIYMGQHLGAKEEKEESFIIFENFQTKSHCFKGKKSY